MKKDCLFQYGTRQKVYEDTELITYDEAKELWNKWLPDLKERWDEFESPEMCIWINCESNTDYHTVGKDIDYRDCELKNGRFYKIIKELIEV